jgi:hypothetical protein
LASQSHGVHLTDGLQKPPTCNPVESGDFNLAGPQVRKRGETGAERPEKGVGGEVLPCFTGSKCHGESLHWPKR